MPAAAVSASMTGKNPGVGEECRAPPRSAPDIRSLCLAGGPAAVAALQRTAGNRAVGALLRARRPGGVGGCIQRAVADEPAPSAPPELLTIGSHGEPVAEVQRALNSLGLGPLAEDGAFGPLTQAAVRSFQGSNGLDPDGIVGPLTRAALFVPAPEATDGEVEPFAAVGPPTAVPDRKDVPCPPYSAAERARSRQSGGGRLDFGTSGERIDSALLFDFEPGSAEVRPVHRAFLKEIVDRFKLGDLIAPEQRIDVIEGFSDCVGFAAGEEAGKTLNASVRLQRAIQIKLALKAAGALFANVIAEPRAGGAKGGPGDEGANLVEGRALNRSVRIVLQQKNREDPGFPGPPGGTGPGPGLCLFGVKSKKWRLTSHVSGSFEAILVGVTGTVFTLQDRVSGRRFIAVFGPGASGGLSTPVELQIAIPSATDFETDPDPVCPGDFDGAAAIFTKFSASTPVPLPFGTPPVPLPVGKMSGDIVLAAKTKPAGIDIGSVQIGVGASTGVATGPFTVIESLPF